MNSLCAKTTPWLRKPFYDLPNDVQELIARYLLQRIRTQLRLRWGSRCCIQHSDGRTVRLLRNDVVELRHGPQVHLWLHLKHSRVRHVYDVVQQRTLSNRRPLWNHRRVSQSVWRLPSKWDILVTLYTSGTRTFGLIKI